MPVKFTVAAEIHEDGSYRWGAESPDGSPVNLLDVVSFFNRAQGDAIGKMVAPPAVEPEPPSEG
jgi:hypothetical protein